MRFHCGQTRYHQYLSIEVVLPIFLGHLAKCIMASLDTCLLDITMAHETEMIYVDFVRSQQNPADYLTKMTWYKSHQ